MAQNPDDPKDSPPPATVPRSLTATFELTPSSAQVWRQTGEGQLNYLGDSGKPLVIGLTEQEAKGSRDLIVEFRVPLSSGEWRSKPHYLPVKKLQASGRYPEEGALALDLGFVEKLQSGQWAGPIWALLTIALGLLTATFIRRQLSRSPSDTNELIAGVELGELLGQGGMGEVYAATGCDGEELAIKMIKSSLTQTPEQQGRFDREIQVGLKLSHPSLVRLYGYGVASDGRVYLSSERLHGTTLKERLRQSDLKRASLAAEILEQVGSVLDYLKTKELVHRDVKPDNIFLCRDGTIKLMDLGIAQVKTLPALTNAGLAMGTPAYMAPEQIRGEAGPAADQYALGLVLFEVLTGRRAFQGTTIEALVHQQAKVQAPDPRELEPRIPVEVSVAILRMLRKQPDERFPRLADARDSASESLVGLSW